MTERFVSIQEAARILGVSKNTIRRVKDDQSICVDYRLETLPQGGAHRQMFIELSSLAKRLNKQVQLDEFYTQVQNGQVGKLEVGEPIQLTQEIGQVAQGSGQVGNLRPTAEEVQEYEEKRTQVQFEQVGIEQAGNDQAGFLQSQTAEPLTLAIQSLSATFNLESYTVEDPTSTTEISRVEHLERSAWVLELYESKKSTPHLKVTELAQKAALEKGISIRQVWRYLDTIKIGKTLGRKRRADVGGTRLPLPLRDLIIQLWLTNPRKSARAIRRIIEMNDASALNYRLNATAQVCKISANTINRTRQWMLTQPVLRYAMQDAKAKREFARIWAGEVMSAHANQLWMADMTRCDTMVYDTRTQSLFRLRIHTVIDVYSGCVPSFVFTRTEDQSATNRMLMLAVLEKPDEWRERWNVWGKPERLYWDNGKTYRSEQSHTTLETLGVEILHSRARVSHSRGNIERFFGTFHGEFERALPGYCGPDTKQRDHQTIKTLALNTAKWLDASSDPSADPYPERLLTEEEYKHKALLWLTMDYHNRVVRGMKTRLDLFLETAPASSRMRYNFGDLEMVMSKRLKRTVRGNGTIHYQGIPWGLKNAGLVPYQGMEIMVLVNDMMPCDNLKAAIQEGNKLRILGTLTSMDYSALSDDARGYRKAAREQVKDMQRLSEEIRAELMRPEWRHDKVLENTSGLPAPAPTTTPTTEFHLTAKLVTDPNIARDAESQALEDEFTKDYVLDEEIDLSHLTNNRL